MFGCIDDPLFIQQNPFTKDLIAVISARMQIIDFRKEISIKKATRMLNNMTQKEYLNNFAQSQFWTE